MYIKRNSNGQTQKHTSLYGPTRKCCISKVVSSFEAGVLVIFINIVLHLSTREDNAALKSLEALFHSILTSGPPRTGRSRWRSQPQNGAKQSKQIQWTHDPELLWSQSMGPKLSFLCFFAHNFKRKLIRYSILSLQVASLSSATLC